jgi:pimeloyl-ACP methyl ester carboxylesterase
LPTRSIGIPSPGVNASPRVAREQDHDCVPVALRTADRVALAATLLSGPVGPVGAATVGVVMAPGFSGSAQRPEVWRVAAGLARHVPVLLLDLRGHGRSGGISTVGDREVLDVDAGVAYLRGALAPGAAVVTCGWSMGGSAVLRQAGLGERRVHGYPIQHRPDAVVSISSPSRWYALDTAAMVGVHWLAMSAVGRLLARWAFGVRIDPAGWRHHPVSPTEAAAGIAPLPLLVVHGDRDNYLGAEHGTALADSAGPHAELWQVEGFGHAENGADEALLERLGTYLSALGTPAGKD